MIRNKSKVSLYSCVVLIMLGSFVACESQSTSPSNAGEEMSSGTEIQVGGEESGTMSQMMECVPNSTGLSSTEEVCDEVDNDCDGEIDEGFEQLGMSCEKRMMRCVSEGVFTCGTDGGIACNAPEIMPSDESCDETDNDCDGQIDEGFALLLDVDNCGECGNVCTFNNGIGRCSSGSCELGSCEPGFEDNNGDPSDGCECNRSSEEVCDGTDNDCDGQIDEGFAIGSACVAGIGACQVRGELSCMDEQQAICNATATMPSQELCNGIDDDCDGFLDEDFDVDEDGLASCEICITCQMSGAEPCPDFCSMNDCVDSDPAQNPLAWDICEDNIDQNCDGADAPCTEAYARATFLSIIASTDSLGTCPDQNGDGLGDNAFGQISGIANPSTANYIEQNQMNIVIGAYQFETDRPSARFNLSVLLGTYYRNSNPPRYLLKNTNFDEFGRPLMQFPFASLANGRLEGGPGTFLFNAPFSNSNGERILIEVPIEGAYIKGDFNYDPNDPNKFTLTNGLVSGHINKQTLQESLVLLDPPIVRVIESLITPDLDLNLDGEPDYYSICLLTTLTGIEVDFEEEMPTP